MCGIAGFLNAGPLALEAEARARAMATAMERRGPDADGVWLDPEAGLALAHRRLSILDLSAAGAQPMQSDSGRWAVSYNGEIYNHLDLRADIAEAGGKRDWRGTSDTETLLAAVELWGVEATLPRLHGMFAVALWDRRDRVLWLARDRMGEKPLYYGEVGGALVFASEPAALAAFADAPLPVDERGVAGLLKYGYVPAPLSIYRGIRKLPPAHFVRIEGADTDAEPVSYWSLESTALAGVVYPFTGSDAEIRDEVEAVLARAVDKQMISDVPLGVFLSGGVDSTLITALMARQRGAGDVRSFSIGFEDAEFNEAGHAEAVAAHLGTDHRSFTVTEADALAIIPELPCDFSEPFADSSQIPTSILCRMTRKHVTVALSGDGGDEVFGGYNRYLHAPAIWNRAGRLPRPARRLVGAVAGALQGRADGRMVGVGLRTLGLPAASARRLSKVGRAVGHAEDFGSFLDNLVSAWPDHERLTPGVRAGLRAEFEAITPSLSHQERMMVFDSLTYMPDDIFVKVDRSAMAHSLETRAPFVDPDVMIAAWRVPMRMKIGGGRGKLVLRDILDRHVPRALMERPKQGFAIPVDAWLRGVLRDWAGDMLASPALNDLDFIDMERARTAFARHQAGVDNHGNQLWPVLMLASWLDARAA